MHQITHDAQGDFGGLQHPVAVSNVDSAFRKRSGLFRVGIFLAVV
ncbi:hypothetical protein [Rhodococcus sp. NPDC006774]